MQSRGLVLAGGQGALSGRILRIGPPRLRSTVEDVIAALAIVERALVDLGRPIDRRGEALAAAARAARRGRGRRRPGVRILVAEPLADEGLASSARTPTSTSGSSLSRDELLGALPDYEALLVRSQVQVDAEAIAAGRRLVVIGRAGVGVDNVDLDAATAAGVTVVNAPTGNTIAAAEHTLALLYALARRIAAADASMRRGEWQRSDVHGHRAARADAGHHRPGQDRHGRRRSRAGAWRWTCSATTRS